MNTLVLSSLLFLGEAQLQETHQGYVSTHVERQAEPSSKQSGPSNIFHQESENGYISEQELKSLSSFLVRDDIQRGLDQVPFIP